MQITKIIAVTNTDTLEDTDGVWSVGTPVAATKRVIRDETIVDGLTLVGSLVPGQPIRLAWDIGDFSFTAAELVAAEETVAALEHEMASADALAVAWLYARI